MEKNSIRNAPSAMFLINHVQLEKQAGIKD